MINNIALYFCYSLNKSYFLSWTASYILIPSCLRRLCLHLFNRFVCGLCDLSPEQNSKFFRHFSAHVRLQHLKYAQSWGCLHYARLPHFSIINTNVRVV